jgi:hypothetical protein
MLYALLQTSLIPPEVERLKRAFHVLPRLVEADAHILANDAYGILVKNLEGHDAAALQGALRVEGIETDLVPQQSLPALPACKLVRRLDCRPDALLVYDPLGRTFPVEWGQMQLIAAGQVRVTEFPRKQTVKSVSRFTADGEAHVEPVVEVSYREERNARLLADLLLAGGAVRFHIEADRFAFDYLGERRRAEVSDNFALFIRDLAKNAPAAAINRGAFHLREEPATLFPYPSRNAYDEEIIWLLWHLGRARKG